MATARSATPWSVCLGAWTASEGCGSNRCKVRLAVMPSSGIADFERLILPFSSSVMRTASSACPLSPNYFRACSNISPGRESFCYCHSVWFPRRSAIGFIGLSQGIEREFSEGLNPVRFRPPTCTVDSGVCLPYSADSAETVAACNFSSVTNPSKVAEIRRVRSMTKVVGTRSIPP